MKQISEAELEIMNYIWKQNRLLTVRDVQDEFEKSNDWKTTTIQTFLKRLNEKDYLEIIKKNRTNYYKYSISKDEYTVMETNKIINKVHSGSMQNFITSFASDKSLSETELNELKAWLDEQ